MRACQRLYGLGMLGGQLVFLRTQRSRLGVCHRAHVLGMLRFQVMKLARHPLHFSRECSRMLVLQRLHGFRMLVPQCLLGGGLAVLDVFCLRLRLRKPRERRVLLRGQGIQLGRVLQHQVVDGFLLRIRGAGQFVRMLRTQRIEQRRMLRLARLPGVLVRLLERLQRLRMLFGGRFLPQLHLPDRRRGGVELLFACRGDLRLVLDDEVRHCALVLLL